MQNWYKKSYYYFTSNRPMREVPYETIKRSELEIATRRICQADPEMRDELFVKYYKALGYVTLE